MLEIGNIESKKQTQHPDSCITPVKQFETDLYLQDDSPLKQITL